MLPKNIYISTDAFKNCPDGWGSDIVWNYEPSFSCVQYVRKSEILDEACRWLAGHVPLDFDVEDFVKDFRKAVESGSIENSRVKTYL